MKNTRFFYLKIFIFLVVKFSMYLNRGVFVMVTKLSLPKAPEEEEIKHHENMPI